MVDLSFRNIDLETLNTATKYPSIETYHALDPKDGMLIESQHASFSGDVLLTEKIDGTNARVIVNHYRERIIGSREEILHYGGDLIYNPAQGIVDVLRTFAGSPVEYRALTVYYFEVYGGTTTPAAREYTGHKEVGYRLLDVAIIPQDVLGESREWISRWRKAGGQEYLPEAELESVAASVRVELAPRVAQLRADQVPTGIVETREWLDYYASETLVPLDDDARGQAEGLVVRTPDRKTIAKIKFKDYYRTIRRMAK